MKGFFTSFFIILTFIFVFLFFGGAVLLQNMWAVIILAALILAVLVHFLCAQSEKLEELEKRIELLEDEKSGG